MKNDFVEPTWIDNAVKTVMTLAALRPDESPNDVFVWDDGTVSGPRDPEDPSIADLHLVAEFTPGETLDRASVRGSILSGLNAAIE